MCIGGIDEVLIAPARESAGDLILRACQRLWRGEVCFFQDANVEDQVHPLSDPWVWKTGIASLEFFVYPSLEAFKAWEEGPTSRNVNQMLHFILGEIDPSGGNIREVAVVFDRETRAIKTFLRDLEIGFRAAIAGEGVRKVA